MEKIVWRCLANKTTAKSCSNSSNPPQSSVVLCVSYCSVILSFLSVLISRSSATSSTEIFNENVFNNYSYGATPHQLVAVGGGTSPTTTTQFTNTSVQTSIVAVKSQLSRRSMTWEGSILTWDTIATLIVPYGIIFVLSVVGNSLVIATLTLNRSMRSVTNIFLLNLAIADLLLGVFCMPFTLIGVLLRRFIFGRIMCHLVSYFQAVSVAVSVWTLVAMSVERYYAICHPLRSRESRQNRKHAYRMLGIVWTMAILLMSPTAIVSRLQLIPQTGHYKCREAWFSFRYKEAFTIFLDLFLLVVPLIAMIATYSSIAVTLAQTIPAKQAPPAQQNEPTTSTSGIKVKNRKWRFRKSQSYSEDREPTSGYIGQNSDKSSYSSITAPGSIRRRELPAQMLGTPAMILDDAQETKQPSSTTGSDIFLSVPRKAAQTNESSPEGSRSVPTSKSSIKFKCRKLKSSSTKSTVAGKTTTSSLTDGCVVTTASSTTAVPANLKAESSHKGLCVPPTVPLSRSGTFGGTALRVNSNQCQMQARQRRIVRMLCVVVIEFFICWTPIFIVDTLALYRPQAVYSKSQELSQFIGIDIISACHLLCFCSSCTNPVTYCFMNARFRRHFVALFRCRKSVGAGGMGPASSHHHHNLSHLSNSRQPTTIATTTTTTHPTSSFAARQTTATTTTTTTSAAPNHHHQQTRIPRVELRQPSIDGLEPESEHPEEHLNKPKSETP